MTEPSDDDSIDRIFQDDEASEPQLTDVDNQSCSSNVRRARGSSLTLNEIRARLDGRARPPSLAPVATLADETVRVTGSQAKNAIFVEDNLQNALTRTLEIIEPVLELSLMLSDERGNGIDESNRIKASVRELEELVDARTDREIGYLNQVQAHQSERFVKKYKTLSSRARQHISETQHQIEQLTTKIAKKLDRTRSVQEEYDFLQRVMMSQKEELDALQEATKNGISERDLTDIRIRLLRLQEENSKLQMEKSKIQQQVDDLENQISKHNPQKTVSLSLYLGLDSTFQITPDLAAEAEEQTAKIAKLEQSVSKLQTEMASRELEFTNLKAKLEQESHHFQEYAFFLINTIEGKT